MLEPSSGFIDKSFMVSHIKYSKYYAVGTLTVAERALT